MQDKFKDISSKLQKDCNMLLVTPLDDIAWMLNLRGTDINYNPLFFSYVLLHRSGPEGDELFNVDLFIDSNKV